MKHYILLNKKQNCLLILLITLKSLIQTGTAIILTKTLNSLIEKQVNQFIIYTICGITLWVIWIIFFYFVNVYKEKTIQNMLLNMRRDIAGHVSKVSYQVYHKETNNTYTSWLNNDIKTIEINGLRPFYQLIDLVMTAVFSSIALINYHYFIFIVTILISLLIAYIPNIKYFRNRMQQASLHLSKEQEKYLSQVNDILKGFDEFFSLNLQKHMISEIAKSSQKLSMEGIQYAKKEIHMSVMTTALNIVGQMIVTIITGVLIIIGYISAGTIISIGQLSSNVFNALGDMSQHLVSINSIKPLFGKFFSLPIQEENGENLEPIQEITLECVNYNYGSGNIFAQPLSMQMKRGGKYAVIGESGSGKSTIMNLLTKNLLDYEGSIKVNGQELSEISGIDLRQQLFTIRQKNYLFNTTVRKNILMGEEIGENIIENALETAKLNPIIKKLPLGLNSEVGQEGINLSGGQSQRVALARGLVSGRSFFILDESTSALDKESAFFIENQLINNKDLTIIMITHHLSPKIEKMLTAVYRI